MKLTEQFYDIDTFFIFYICFLAAVIGLVMGSFLNCAAIRIVNGEPIARGRSHCMKCGHVLGVLDLVPLFSWLALGGRCRYCGEKISARYPLSELAAAIAFVSVVLLYGITNQGFEMLILMSLLLAISFSDIENYLIPDRFIIAGILLRIVYIFAASFFPERGDMSYGMEPLEALNSMGLESLIGGLSVAFPLMLLVLVMEKLLHKDFMGGGDVKLLFMIGIYFNWAVNVFSIMTACILGIIGGTVLKKRGILEIPFGPFIVAGAWIGMLVGKQITDCYFGLF